MHSRALLGIATLLLTVAAACAPKTIVRPTGARAPLSDGPALFEGATLACRDVHALTAELRISGHVGRQKLRGRAIVGVAEPAALRLEGVAPFGPPAFILVARDGRGTLLLPRDHRVVRDAPPERILDALTGVALTPSALRALLAGCFAPASVPTGGEKYGDRWALLTFDTPGDQVYLRRDEGNWRLVAATVGSITVEYDQFAGPRPQWARVRTAAAPGPASELTLALSQVEINTRLEAAAFEVKIPSDADPLTLDELRAAGPLGQSRD